MQQTRLTTLFAALTARLEVLLSNPWRRVSLSLISILFGFFLGSAISTTAGQAANWDITVSIFLILATEAISRLVYGRDGRLRAQGKLSRSLGLELVNICKIGLVYSLYLEALKLGS